MCDEKGQDLGPHKGLIFYTEGQRKGLGLSRGPWFVARRHFEDGTMILRHDSEEKIFRVRFLRAVWQHDVHEGHEYSAQYCYRFAPVAAILKEYNGESGVIEFSLPVGGVSKPLDTQFVSGVVLALAFGAMGFADAPIVLGCFDNNYLIAQEIHKRWAESKPQDKLSALLGTLQPKVVVTVGERADDPRANETVAIVKAAVAALIGRTKDYPAAKMIPWLQLGLEVEETEWIRRAAVGREEERDLACAQSKLLTAYRLNIGLEKYPELSEYMAEYREQKCADAISDEFVNKAFKSSVPDEVVSRMVLLSEFKSDPETAVLVVDALGVEYLPFLIARCKSHRFDPKVVDCVRVNLPTSTPYNPVEKEWGTTGRYRKYDDFDHLLHESFEDHAEALAAELMRIDVQVMGEIENLLKTYRRVVLTADHGATRLAVVARRDGKSRDITEFADKIDVLDWRYAKRKNAEYLDSELVAESIGEGYVLMKGYNRFSKSGAPGFEMHGGATIEEQVVPFMVIERAIVLDNAAQDESAVVSAVGGADQISENDEFDI